MQYAFSDTSISSFNKRFEIHFSKVIKLNIQVPLQSQSKITYNQEQIFISIPAQVHLPITLKITDLLGKELYEATFNEREIIIQKLNVPVILILYNDQEKCVKKIF